MRAVVQGAGIAGLTAAWWLERDGWDVVVVEQAPAPRSAGYMIDFFGPGFEVADRMGLVGRLRDRAASIFGLQYVDPEGRPRGWADYGAFRRAAAGRLMSLPRGDLAAVLLESVADRVELRWGTTVERVTRDGGRPVTALADGSALEADLLVGADGLRSWVRRAVAAPTTTPGADLRSLGYHTAAFVLDDDALRARVRDRMVLVAAPHRQVALYPTGDGRLAAWLVHRADGAVPADPVGAVQEAYGGLGPQVDRVLSHLGPGTDLYYDDVAQSRAERWSRDRAVLVGDAAAAPSLMAGQGASLAMTGAWVLARELRGAGDATAIPSALERYEAVMRPFAERRQASGRATARWLVPSSTIGIAVRQAFLALARLPGTGPLVRRAFGTSTDPGLPD